MIFDQPALITECDGCGGRHHNGEQWVSCLIGTLQKTRAALARELDHPDRIRGRRVREDYESWAAYSGARR